MGLMEIASKAKQAKAVFSGNLNLLDEKKVCNLFPKKNQDFNREKLIKDTEIMLEEHKISLAVDSILSRTKRQKINYYRDLRKNFKKKSRKLIRAWNKAKELEFEKNKIKDTYELRKQDALNLHVKTEKAKKLLVADSNDWKLAIETKKADWVENYLKKLKEALKKEKEEYYRNLKNNAIALFKEYAGDNEKKLEQLKKGSYSWGLVTRREEAVKTKEAYYAYHKYKNFDEWLQSEHKEVYGLLSSKNDFDSFSGKSDILKNFPKLKKSYDEVRKSISKFEELDQSRSGREGKALEVYKESLKNDIKRFLNALNELEEAYQKYLSLIESYSKTCGEAKKQCAAVLGNLQILEKEGLFGNYKEEDDGALVKKFGVQITLRQVLVGIRYYFTLFYEYFSEEGKINVEKEKKDLKEDYKKAKGKMATIEVKNKDIGILSPDP